MVRLLLLTLTFGCSTKAIVGETGDIPETGDSEGGDESGGVEDSADSGEGEGEPEDISVYDGVYSGDFSVTASVYGFGDTCSGTADFAIVSGTLVGTASCAFPVGGTAYYLGLTDTYAGVIDGTVTSSTDVSGTLSVDLGDGFSADWTGAFDGTTLTSTFAGTFSYSGWDLDYDGSFSGTPG